MPVALLLVIRMRAVPAVAVHHSQFNKKFVTFHEVLLSNQQDFLYLYYGNKNELFGKCQSGNAIR
jgi:hypothetical protein